VSERCKLEWNCQLLSTIFSQYGFTHSTTLKVCLSSWFLVSMSYTAMSGIMFMLFYLVQFILILFKEITIIFGVWW